jgi:CrcB protein
MNAPAFPVASLLVAFGGGFGAWLRYAAGRLVGVTAFPVATLAVNVVGSLAMGLLAGWLARHGAAEGWRLLLGVGVLGGFTTFSAFSLDLVLMLQRGEAGAAFAYAGLSLLLGISALYAGLSVARAL